MLMKWTDLEPGDILKFKKDFLDDTKNSLDAITYEEFYYDFGAADFKFKLKDITFYNNYIYLYFDNYCGHAIDYNGYSKSFCSIYQPFQIVEVGETNV